MNEDQLTPAEAVRRIRSSEIGSCSCNTKVALRRLADAYEKLALQFEAAEQAIRGFGVCYEKLQALPELNEGNFDVEEVMGLNDGVCEVCCEMETTQGEYDAALNKLDVQPQVENDT